MWVFVGYWGAEGGKQRHIVLGRLCEAFGLEKDPVTWDSGVLGEKYLGDHGLGIFFLLLVELTHP